MLRVRLYRSPSWEKRNRKLQGIFTKDFDTVEDIVRFFQLTKRKNTIYCVDLQKDIGAHNISLLIKKGAAISNKQCARTIPYQQP